MGVPREQQAPHNSFTAWKPRNYFRRSTSCYHSHGKTLLASSEAAPTTLLSPAPLKTQAWTSSNHLWDLRVGSYNTTLSQWGLLQKDENVRDGSPQTPYDQFWEVSQESLECKYKNSNMGEKNQGFNAGKTRGGMRQDLPPSKYFAYKDVKKMLPGASVREKICYFP